MIVIYRGEDTDFAGAEPIKITIDTELNLSGFTADILFGNVVKHFEPEEVETKALGLVYTAAETAGFFPGKGYAVVKVYDKEGRVAYLKKFIIDVRFRDNRVTDVDLAFAVNVIDNVRKVAEALPDLNEVDNSADIKATLNSLLAAIRARGEFEPLTPRQMMGVSAEDARTFLDAVRRLEEKALSIETLDGDSNTADIKDAINQIMQVVRKIKN